MSPDPDTGRGSIIDYDKIILKMNKIDVVSKLLHLEFWFDIDRIRVDFRF